MTRAAKGWGSVAVAVLGAGAWLWWSAAHGVVYQGPAQPVPRPTQGPAGATLVLEEFSDFQCPACKSAEATVKDVVATFGDRVRYSYHHFPLVTIHTQAFRAALAAECAHDQGKFWEYHDVLFDKQPNFSRNELVDYARQLGLTIDGSSGFAACLDSRVKTDIVRADMREGDQRGVNSTPTFYLNGEAVADWSRLRSLIQGKLLGG